MLDILYLQHANLWYLAKETQAQGEMYKLLDRKCKSFTEWTNMIAYIDKFCLSNIK